MFDGLDMHLYTLVAAPFVALHLGGLATTDPAVGYHASIIQGAFLLGWALGGGGFGFIGDRLGRSRTLSLTVLTYAAAFGTVFFGLFSKVGDHRAALFYAGFLFVPAALARADDAEGEGLTADFKW